MIITRLCGGLGNQIFQWAIAQNLAYKYDTDFYCDLDHFKGLSLYTEDRIKERPNSVVTAWGLELHKTNVSAQFVTAGAHGLKQVDENHAPANIEDNSYLSGFWQSEKYFIDNESKIRSKLDMTEEQKDNIYSIYPFLKDSSALSLHVRRGDYVNIQHVHPCQTGEYYDKALEEIGQIENILVFSDDIHWCKQNFKYDNMVFAEKQDNITDLYTMSLCSHNIIANSSFSWWGAWLNKNENKKIIAPRKWFSNAAESQHIIPNNWAKI